MIMRLTKANPQQVAHFFSPPSFPQFGESARKPNPLLPQITYGLYLGYSVTPNAPPWCQIPPGVKMVHSPFKHRWKDC